MADEAPEEVSPAKMKTNILKSIFFMSLAFLLVFNGYQGLVRLQSSVFLEEDMEIVCQVVLHASHILACLFLPKFIIRTMSHKITIATSLVGYILYLAAHAHAGWGTMIPASILWGICAAHLWTAQGSYFTKSSIEYARLTEKSEKHIGSLFFGIFFMFFQISSIISSLIAYDLLPFQPLNLNGTNASDEQAMAVCGAEYCLGGSDSFQDTVEISQTTLVLILLGYFWLAFLGVVVLCLVAEFLPRHIWDEPPEGCRDFPKFALATLRQMALPAQLLLIPLSFYTGLEQAYYHTEFTQSFVSCSLGFGKVGLVTLPYGCVNSLVAIISGHLVKYTGRMPLFAAAGVVDLCTQLTLLLWAQRPSQEYVLYILAGMWGFSDGVWQTQINALYGELFPDDTEAAFSNYRLWRSVGFIMAASNSNALCTAAKTYILLCMLGIGLACYYVGHRKTKPRHRDDTPEENNNNSPDGAAVIDHVGLDNRADWSNSGTRYWQSDPIGETELGNQTWPATNFTSFTYGAFDYEPSQA